MMTRNDSRQSMDHPARPANRRRSTRSATSITSRSDVPNEDSASALAAQGTNTVPVTHDNFRPSKTASRSAAAPAGGRGAGAQRPAGVRGAGARRQRRGHRSAPQRDSMQQDDDVDAPPARKPVRSPRDSPKQRKKVPRGMNFGADVHGSSLASLAAPGGYVAPDIEDAVALERAPAPSSGDSSAALSDDANDAEKSEKREAVVNADGTDSNDDEKHDGNSVQDERMQIDAVSAAPSQNQSKNSSSNGKQGNRSAAANSSVMFEGISSAHLFCTTVTVVRELNRVVAGNVM